MAAKEEMKDNSSCIVYEKNAENCKSNCGSCFNAGSRRGVLCEGQQTGYYCPSDNPPAGSGMAYACLDWTFQSTAMIAAENAYNLMSGDDPIYFGVGTYGDSQDAQRGLGACFLLDVEGVDRKLLVQSINTGSDVDGNQFDLQIGDGGAGAFNTCAGGDAHSMFPGSYDTWGKQYGGVDFRANCSKLPSYPTDSDAMRAAGDDLIALCQASFDKNVRGEGGSNPSIQSVTRVKCPELLINLTQIQRSDEPTTDRSIEIDRIDADHECQADRPGGSLAWCLTRMMDCRKPSGGFKDNVRAELTVPGRRLVQPCTSDGYTRIDVQCGCYDCYC